MLPRDYHAKLLMYWWECLAKVPRIMTQYIIVLGNHVCFVVTELHNDCSVPILSSPILLVQYGNPVGPRCSQIHTP